MRFGIETPAVLASSREAPSGSCGAAVDSLALDALADLWARWQRARRAALRAVLLDEEAGPKDVRTETALAIAAFARNEEEAQRRLFDNSRRLALSFVRFQRLALQPQDATSLLDRLGSPCLSGPWTWDPDGKRANLTRDPCEARGDTLAVCAMWRESLGGFVQGLCGLRHVCLEGCALSKARCVDVLYVDPEDSIRFGVLSDEVRPVLDRIRMNAMRFDTTGELEFLGVLNDELFFRYRPGLIGNIDVISPIFRAIKKTFPHLRLREVGAPRAPI